MTTTTLPAALPPDHDAQADRGYVNADGSARPFPWWYSLMIVGMATVLLPFLLGGLADNLFLRRAHVQRWTVILAVGTLQIMRVLFALIVFKVVWTWLAWTLGLLLIWRIWKIANVWWALIEDPATWAKQRGSETV